MKIGNLVKIKYTHDKRQFGLVVEQCVSSSTVWYVMWPGDRKARPVHAGMLEVVE